MNKNNEILEWKGERKKNIEKEKRERERERERDGWNEKLEENGRMEKCEKYKERKNTKNKHEKKE